MIAITPHVERGSTPLEACRRVRTGALGLTTAMSKQHNVIPSFWVDLNIACTAGKDVPEQLCREIWSLRRALIIVDKRYTPLRGVDRSVPQAGIEQNDFCYATSRYTSASSSGDRCRFSLANFEDELTESRYCVASRVDSRRFCKRPNSLHERLQLTLLQECGHAPKL